jgi:hypothetical protein
MQNYISLYILIESLEERLSRNLKDHYESLSKLRTRVQSLIHREETIKNYLDFMSDYYDIGKESEDESDEDDLDDLDLDFDFDPFLSTSSITKYILMLTKRSPKFYWKVLSSMFLTCCNMLCPGRSWMDTLSSRRTLRVRTTSP